MERVKDIVHYIISKDVHHKLGAIKLNKVLWFADSIYYTKEGKSLSGQENYIKRKYGPVVGNMPSILSELERDGKISIEEETRHTYRRTTYKSLTECEIDLSKEDRELLEGVLEEVCYDFTAAELSDETHDIIWDAVEIGDPMPLYTVFASRPGVVTEEQIDWATACINAA